MSKLLVTLVVLCAILVSPSQAKKPQRIENPHYEYRTDPTHTVRSIEKSDTATVLEIEARLYPGGWFKFENNVQLYDKSTDTFYDLRSASGIKLNEQCTVPESGQMRYKLIFPPLDKNIAKVDILFEGQKGKCRTYGLRIDSVKPSLGNGVLDALQGNWFAADGSGDWTIGFLGNLVVWKNDFWHTTAPDRKGVMELINRSNNALRDTIMVAINKDGSCTIGTVGAKGVRKVREQKVASNYPRAADDDRSWSDREMITGGKALLRGVILGYNPDLGWSKGQVNVGNAFLQDDRNFLIEVAADGTFQTEIELSFPSEVMIALNDRYSRFHVAPSDTIVMCVSHDELSRPMRGFRKIYAGAVYMGDHARLNAQIGRYYEAIPMVSIQDQYRTMGYREFAPWYEKYSAECRVQKEEYIKANNLSRKAVDYIRLSHAIEAIHMRHMYPSQREYHLNQDTTIKDRDLNIPMSFFRIDENFPVNDPKIVTVRETYYLANGIEFMLPVRNAAIMIELSTMERLRGEAFAPETRAVIDSLEKGLLELNHSNINYYMSYLNILDNEIENCQPFARQIMLSQVGRVLSDSLGIASGSFLGDVIKTSVACRNLDSLHDATQMSLLLDQFAHHSAMRWLLEYNEKQRPAVAQATVEVETSKETEKMQDSAKTSSEDAEAILARVLAPYAGKIVYLDFWAMWCGPCRGGMEQSYRVKDLLSKNKDVVFAYITTEKDSPKASREKFIADNKITGEFLLVSRDEWVVLCSSFNIVGIPHYMIIGRDGKVIDPQCRLHGSGLADRLKELSQTK